MSAASSHAAVQHGATMAHFGANTLGWFEVPRPLIEPTLRALRLGNTLLDALFYDVDVLARELRLRGSLVVTGGGEPAAPATSETTFPFSTLDLSALANPEGAILVVDSGRPPHVRRFEDVREFLDWVNVEGQAVTAASVTGVGSSALGSVAFAWNISTALDEPVAAIVPGYGVADVVQQGLGGWFGFGMHTWWIKQASQEMLAHLAPQTAGIGRQLMKTAPGHAEASTGAPVFRRGSGSSDVLHAILRGAPQFSRLFGHSKGALVIENAILGLPEEITERLHIATFGCPIGEDTNINCYSQFLGLFDSIGWLNSWGNRPETMIPTHHSTNTRIPFSMPVSRLTRIGTVQKTPAPDAITHEPKRIAGPTAMSGRQRGRARRK
jgi:hypothetical protein